MCCGVSARADLFSSALAEARIARGTNNVDFNPPMLAALVGLRGDPELAGNDPTEGAQS